MRWCRSPSCGRRHPRLRHRRHHHQLAAVAAVAEAAAELDLPWVAEAAQAWRQHSHQWYCPSSL